MLQDCLPTPAEANDYTGKTLFGIGSIVITDERKELVDFIEYYPASYVLVVRADDYEIQKENIFKRVKYTFHRTFIKDNSKKIIPLIKTKAIAFP